MNIDLSHYRVGGVDIAIFDADAQSRTRRDRQQVLADLTAKARLANLHVDRSVLKFVENGQVTYFGDRDLVQHLIHSRLVYQPNRRLTV
jgi:hypothetical protein